MVRNADASTLALVAERNAYRHSEVTYGEAESSVAFSPDGTKIISGFVDGIKLWGGHAIALECMRVL
eukprot:5174019-Prymnesium_polylepis.1